MKPRRSVLSVPGHMEKMHRKAAGCPADVVMLDLEDSVPVDLKEAARQQVIRSLRDLDWGQKTLSFRINALDTPFGYRDLLEVAESAGGMLDSVVVPKVGHPGDIYFVERMLSGIELCHGWPRPLGVEAGIETAAGLDRVSEIVNAGTRLVSLVFGIADYQASIGARLVSLSGHGEEDRLEYPGHRWHFVMSRLVMAAKAKGLAALDAPFGNFKDLQGLRRSAAVSLALGFDGKWAIHPDQIPVINGMFQPSQEDVHRAGKVLEAHRRAVASGRGAVSVDGRMVDQATVRIAERTWAQAVFLGMARQDPVDGQDP